MTKATLYTQLNTENCYAIVCDEYAKSVIINKIKFILYFI